MNYGQKFMTLYRRHGARSSPRKRNAEKQKGYLKRPKNTEKRREAKAKEKRKDMPI